MKLHLEIINVISPTESPLLLFAKSDHMHVDNERKNYQNITYF